VVEWCPPRWSAFQIVEQATCNQSLEICHLSDGGESNWGIIVEFTENAQLWTARSAHGSSYSYDREVPIIFMGKGVTPGIATGGARTIDVAPTLAEIAGVEYPAISNTALKRSKIRSWSRSSPRSEMNIFPSN